MLIFLRRSLALILFLLGAVMLVWATWPAGRQMSQQVIGPDGMRLSSDGSGDVAALLETRQVSLEWPSSMRIGDKYQIQLVFEPAVNDVDQSALQTGHVDAYSRYNLMVEGRIEAAGINLALANPTRESLPPGNAVRFVWEVSVDRLGVYNGTAWLSLRFLPLDGGSPMQVPIYVRPMQMHTTGLFNLSGPMVRMAGSISLSLSAAFGFSDLMSWLRRRKVASVTKGKVEAK